MKKVLSIVIALILLINTTLAYTVKITVKGVDLVVTGEVGNTIEIEKKLPEIVGWEVKSGNIEIIDNAFVMPEGNVEIEAIIEEEPEKYMLTVETNDVIRTEYKNEGQSVTVSMELEEPYSFINWTATGIELTEEQKISSTITFTMPSNDVTLIANYAESTISFNWDTTDQLTKTIKVKTKETTQINWGDGTKEIVSNSPETVLLLSHTYEMAGMYNVNLMNNAVTYLYSANNKINSIDVRKNTELINLNVNTNAITSIDLSQLTKLETLDMVSNQLTELNVDDNVNLKHLDCGNNPNIGTLNLANNTKLQELSCWNNGLTSLNLDNNSKLVSLYAPDNQITSINLVNNPELLRVNLNNSDITSINLSQLTKLETLDMVANQLTGLSVDANVNLKHLDCGSNPNIGTLNLSNNTKLQELSCWNNGLTSLNIDNNTELTILTYWDNAVGNINLSNNTKLKQIRCARTNLSNLDLTNNTQLELLYCYSNPLTQLILSNNTQLTDLVCKDLQLTTLDVSNNMLLNKMCCTQKSLQTLYLNATQNDNMNIIDEDKACSVSIETNNTIHKYTGTNISIKN